MDAGQDVLKERKNLEGTVGAAVFSYHVFDVWMNFGEVIVCFQDGVYDCGGLVVCWQYNNDLV